VSLPDAGQTSRLLSSFRGRWQASTATRRRCTIGARCRRTTASYRRCRRKTSSSGVHDDLAELVAAELGSDSGATVRVRRGHPAEVVLEAAADAVALVVGRSGHGGLTELLRVGSVARACAEHAPCPVVVVPVAAHGSASHALATAEGDIPVS
jgi:nucleotide-binding universal stress UspA family protein